MTPCLVAGWAEKGQVVMVNVRLNVGQQCVVTTSKADCGLSYPGRSVFSRSNDLTVSLHGMLVSSQVQCCLHLCPLASSREM